MKQDEFAYWLQGYFELRENDNPLTLAQGICIRNHLELVKTSNITPIFGKKTATAAMKPITGFCAWLDGALEMAGHSAVDGLLSTISLNLIKNKLAAEFVHVIDPKSPGDKEVLQAVHDGLQKPSSIRPKSRPRPSHPNRPGGTMRC